MVGKVLKIALVFILCVSMAFSQEAKDYQYDNWVLVKNESLAVSFKLPQDWAALESSDKKEIAYFKANAEGVADIGSKKLKVLSFLAPNSFKDFADDRVKTVKGREGGKIFVSEKTGSLNSIPTRVITYAQKIDDVQRVTEEVLLQYEKRFYVLTFTVANEYVESTKGLKDQIFASFNFAMMQPSVKWTVKKPEKWIELQDNEYPFAFAHPENKGASASGGIIKAKSVRVEADLPLQAFVQQLIGKLAMEGEKSDAIANAKVKNNDMIWFDIIDSENAFVERYHVFKNKYTFYIVSFISSKELFEKELKAELAKFLMSLEWGE